MGVVKVTWPTLNFYRSWNISGMAKDGNFTFFVYCLQCFDTVNWAAGRACKKQRGGVLAWLVVCSDVQICIWPSRCHCHPLSLASAKSRLVLPFWYRLTRVVPDTGPLNGCVCVCVRACVRACVCVCGWPCKVLAFRWVTVPLWARSPDSFLYFGLRKLCHRKTSVYWCDQQKSVVDGQLVDYTYDGRARRGWMRNAQVYYTLVDCNPLIPLLRSVLDLSYKLFIHCCAAVGMVLTNTSRRAVHLKSFLLHPLLHTMSRMETAETSIVRTRATEKGKYIIDKYTYVSTWRTSYLLDFSPGLIRPLFSC